MVSWDLVVTRILFVSWEDFLSGDSMHFDAFLHERSTCWIPNDQKDCHTNDSKEPKLKDVFECLITLRPMTPVQSLGCSYKLSFGFGSLGPQPRTCSCLGQSSIHQHWIFIWSISGRSALPCLARLNYPLHELPTSKAPDTACVRCTSGTSIAQCRISRTLRRRNERISRVGRCG